jgi:hypothetical protein
MALAAEGFSDRRAQGIVQLSSVQCGFRRIGNSHRIRGILYSGHCCIDQSDCDSSTPVGLENREFLARVGRKAHRNQYDRALRALATLSTSRAALVVRWTGRIRERLAEILPVITVFAASSLAPRPAAPMSRRLRRLRHSRRASLRHLTLRRNPGSPPVRRSDIIFCARASDQPLIAP